MIFSVTFPNKTMFWIGNKPQSSSDTEAMEWEYSELKSLHGNELSGVPTDSSPTVTCSPCSPGGLGDLWGDKPYYVMFSTWSLLKGTMQLDAYFYLFGQSVI